MEYRSERGSAQANVVAVLGGKSAGEAALTQRHGLIINGHMDVVGVQRMNGPFRLRSGGDQVFARGAADITSGPRVPGSTPRLHWTSCGMATR